jgi:hypothetical protein
MKSIHRLNLLLVLLTMPTSIESNRILESCQTRIFATRRAVRSLNCPLPPINDQMSLAYCQVALLQIKIRLRNCRRKPKVHYAKLFRIKNSITRRSTLYYMNNIDIYKTTNLRYKNVAKPKQNFPSSSSFLVALRTTSLAISHPANGQSDQIKPRFPKSSVKWYDTTAHLEKNKNFHFLQTQATNV